MNRKQRRADKKQGIGGPVPAPAVQSMFADALRLHQAGRPTEAERLYRQILEIDPKHADTLHMYGLLYLQVGRPDIAADLIGKAVAYRPDDIAALCNLGNALQAQGKLDNAVAAFKRTLIHGPELVEAYYNQGNALRAQGKLNEAAACYERALVHRPDYSDTACNLGSVLQDLGKLDAAVAVYRQALTHQSEDADTYYNLGNALQKQDKLDAAAVAYQQALVFRPDLAGAHCNLGNTLKDLGQFGGAEDSFLRAINLTPSNAKFHFDLTEVKRFTANDDPQLVLMEAMMQEIAALPVDEQTHLRFALGKAYEDLGAHAQSFGHLLSGNRLKRSLLRYDETAALALFERIQATFTADLIGGKSMVGTPHGGPIFVVGMPRSGTTLIEQILASHHDVFGAGELPLFERVTTAFLGKGAFPELVADLPTDDLHALGAHYRTTLWELAPGAARITDKLLQNFLYSGLIHLALPDARIIHAHRNPVDTCLSCFSKLFTSGHPYIYDLAELGRYYRHYARLMDHWRQVLPAGVMLDVAYEEVVDDLEGQARRILAHCGLAWDDACLAFDKTKRPVRTASATQVRQPIYKSSVGRWKPDAAVLKPLIAEIGRP